MIEGVIVGVVSSSIYSLLRKLGGDRAAKYIEDERFNLKYIESEGYSSALNNLEQIKSSFQNEAQDGFLKFMQSVEMTNCVNQLLAFLLLNRKIDEKRILSEIEMSIEAYIEDAEFDVSDLSKRIYKSFLSATKSYHSLLVSNGHIEGHEKLAGYRTNLILDEIDGLKKIISNNSSFLDMKRISSLEGKYKTTSYERFSKITIYDIHSSPRYPLDKIYIEPRLTEIKREKERDYSDFAVESKRAVILGSPGAGKTTIARRIFCDSLVGKIKNNKTTFPLLVVLREYDKVNSINKVSFKDYLINQLNNEFCLDIEGHELEYLLLTGRVLVFFDGLDELMEVHNREIIRDNIESFSKSYPKVPVIVTSRYVGYENSPFDEKYFSLYKLSDFNEEDVRKYTNKWFSLNPELSAKDRAGNTDNFLQESNSVKDIRRNPLMLALMCRLYQARGFVPDTIPEIYEKCAELFFEEWDRKRGIVYQLEGRDYLLPSIRYIASYLLSEKENNQISSSEIHNVFKKYLLSCWICKEEKAEKIVKAFVDFCTGRAWIFTSVGFNHCNDELFEFCHRTFLEYYAGDYLANTAEGTEEFIGNLITLREKSSSWEVPSKIAVYIYSKSQDRLRDQIFRYLLQEYSSENDFRKKQSIAFFALQIYSFVTPGEYILLDFAKCISEIVDCLVDVSVFKGQGKVVGAHNENATDVHVLITDGFQSLSNSKRNDLLEISIDQLKTCLVSCQMLDAEQWLKLIMILCSAGSDLKSGKKETHRVLNTISLAFTEDLETLLKKSKFAALVFTFHGLHDFKKVLLDHGYLILFYRLPFWYYRFCCVENVVCLLDYLYSLYKKKKAFNFKEITSLNSCNETVFNNMCSDVDQINSVFITPKTTGHFIESLLSENSYENIDNAFLLYSLVVIENSDPDHYRDLENSELRSYCEKSTNPLSRILVARLKHLGKTKIDNTYDYLRDFSLSDFIDWYKGVCIDLNKEHQFSD